MGRLRIGMLVGIVCLMGLGWAVEPVIPVAPSLKQRQPHWRPHVIQTHVAGNPAQVEFREIGAEGAEIPVKQVFFFPSGQIQMEADLTVVPQDAAVVEQWKSTVVPHGMNVSYFSNGQVEKIAFYDRGVLHGPMKMFFENGQLRGECVFRQGERHGAMVAYYENGAKQEEGTFDSGKVVGDLVKYYPSGNRAALVPYAQGVPHGVAMQWYEGGALKSSLSYREGLLHSEGKSPAVVVYGEDRVIIEVQDFDQGQPIGMHVKYHPNGKEAYKVQYKAGKKQGKEQFFGAEGQLLGEGLYHQGTPQGDHERRTEGGVLVYSAHYRSDGTLTQPIQEFSPQGIKLAEYSIQDGVYDGPFLIWYEEGTPRTEYLYNKGRLEGEQREYYPNGALRLRARYHDHVRDGLFEEWYENGQPSLVCHLSHGEKDGVSEEWYESGTKKKEEFYVHDALDKTYREWFPNGALKITCDFSLGKKHGVYKEYDEAKALLVDARYDKDRPVGLMRTFYGKDQPKEIINFNSQGEKEGKSEEYHPNGQLKAVADYKADLLEGEVKMWFEDGSVSALKFFKKGKPIGEQKEYFSKDSVGDQGKKSPLQIARLFRYDDNGELEGEQRSFYPTGAVQTVVNYSHGQLHGLKAMWNDQGVLIEEATYDHDKLTGRFFEKIADGKEMIFHYKDNKKEGLHEVYYPSHDYFGKVKALEVNFVNDLAEGDAIEYNESGVKVAQTRYVHGKKEGEAHIFSPKGEVLAIISFHDDKRHGPSVQYYSQGKVFVEGHYVDDLKEGVEKTYYEDGRIAKEIPYHAGQIHGKYQEWNPQGALVFEGEYKEGKREGVFNKYYDNGNPWVLQSFHDDQLHGIKKSYDPEGKLTESRFDQGKKVL